MAEQTPTTPAVTQGMAVHHWFARVPKLASVTTFLISWDASFPRSLSWTTTINLTILGVVPRIDGVCVLPGNDTLNRGDWTLKEQENYLTALLSGLLQKDGVQYANPTTEHNLQFISMGSVKYVMMIKQTFQRWKWGEEDQMTKNDVIEDIPMTLKMLTSHIRARWV